MRRTTAPILAVSGLMALFAPGCGGGTQPATTSAEIKDVEVRTYIRDSLVPYLDSLTKETCRARDADGLPKNWLCDPVTDTYKPPPKNGTP